MKPTKIMNWVALLLFLVSLFLPMERHAVPGPCEWPCFYPFTYTLLNNTILFLFAPLFFLMSLLFWQSLRLVLMAIAFSLIGMGEVLLLLTPFFENRINSPFRQRVHLVLACLAVLGTLSYSLVEDFRLGFDPLLGGYYYFVLALLLIAASSGLRFMNGHNENSSR